MTEIAGNGQKLIKMVGMAKITGNDWTWLDIARMGGYGSIYLVMALISYKWIEMARNCWNGLIWLEMTGNGLKGDGFIIVMGIWGV